MKNFVQPGSTITVVAPYALTPGAGCLVGLIFGVACAAYASGAVDAELQTEGVFDLDALNTDTASGTAPVAAYWDNTNKRITVSSAGNTKVGVITQAKTSGQTTARVRLNGVF
jgi:predicted RecA/RadA family phage recombinase